MILGIDTSTHFEELQKGAKYFLDGKEINPLEAFRSNNVSVMRIRVWNNPYDEEGNPYLAGTCDVNNFLKLAKLARSLGYEILLDLHYSDFWADPAKQTCPKAWVGKSFEEIEECVYEFTKEVLAKAKSQGIDISYIQIGNEITNGMVWPYGKLDISVSPRTGYENLTRLLKSGIKGAKEIFKDIKIIIHLERSFDQVTYREYFENLRKFGVNYDIIGMSYYPYWHGTFDEFFANVEMCKKEFNKEIFIMETSFAFTTKDYLIEEGKDPQLVINEKNEDELSQKLPYPMTIEGQEDYVKELIRLSKVHGIGAIFYWEPCWIPGEGICWSSPSSQKYIHEEGKEYRNEWCNQCLFDYEGNALPGFSAYKLD